MGCRSEYMEANDREKESRLVAELLCILLSKIGQHAPSSSIREMAEHIYGDINRIDEVTALLCKALGSLTEEQLDAYVYNGRDADARRLASWWDRHQEFDRKRKELEERQKNADELRAKTAKLIASVKTKITQEEWEAVEHYFSEEYHYD